MHDLVPSTRPGPNGSDGASKVAACPELDPAPRTARRAIRALPLPAAHDAIAHDTSRAHCGDTGRHAIPCDAFRSSMQYHSVLVPVLRFGAHPTDSPCSIIAPAFDSRPSPHANAPASFLSIGTACVAVALFACSKDSATASDHGIPDLNGLANFIVDSARLASSWTIGSDNVEAGSCTSIEYGITPGTHRVLRFTVSTPNIGDADAVVGDPLAHIDPNHDGDFSDSDGLFEYAPCHNHFHYKHYATYELLPVLEGGALGAPILARKRGFCLDDSEPRIQRRVQDVRIAGVDHQVTAPAPASRRRWSGVDLLSSFFRRRWSCRCLVRRAPHVARSAPPRRFGTVGCTTMRRSLSSSRADLIHVAPPSVDMYTPRPQLTVLRSFASPVPTYIGFDPSGAMARSPIAAPTSARISARSSGRYRSSS